MMIVYMYVYYVLIFGLRRVLYLAMSPDGESVVTGAGDETLRFWNLFPETLSKAGNWSGVSVLLPSAGNIR